MSELLTAIDRLSNGEPVQQVFPDEALYDGEVNAVLAGLKKLAYMPSEGSRYGIGSRYEMEVEDMVRAGIMVRTVGGVVPATEGAPVYRFARQVPDMPEGWEACPECGHHQPRTTFGED